MPNSLQAELRENHEKFIRKDSAKTKPLTLYNSSTTSLCIHYLTLTVLGFLVWGLVWSGFGDGWCWDGPWFKIAAVGVVAWVTGEALQGLTTLPASLAALLIGILARNLNILNMREYTDIDAFLRKVYPVVILGKASLGWNLHYIAGNWCQVSTLGVLPWSAEVVVVAVCVHLLLDFPWIWGFLLGSIYASVSCAVVMPAVLRHGAHVERTNWPQLICTAGGVDTGLSVGVYGLLHSFMFYDANYVYQYVKAALTLFAGVALGVMWGNVAKLLPYSGDYYVNELRVLFLLLGGLVANFVTSLFGWGGVGGVAVLVCNATSAMHWSRDGWELNSNAASRAYRIMWAILEPMLFAYTGTFFVIDSSITDTMILGIGILTISLFARLLVTFLVCWNMRYKERLFVCCTWIPKSIVEAVLCPLAIGTLLSRQQYTESEMRYAEGLMNLTIQAILITTPLGFLLTNHVGPRLIKEIHKSDNLEDKTPNEGRQQGLTNE